MGVVYRAGQLSLDRIVAIKMILSGPFASVQSVQRFRMEAAAAANLRHPNIVAIHDFGEHQGQPYFSMEFVNGRNLAGLVRDQWLPARQSARYLRIISEAIQCAHQQGTLHRDLKPSNVLIDENDQPRITDFGLARRIAGDSDLTLTGQTLGSPNYMPPEQASGQRGGIGPHNDIYSLGAILYHLLTGRPPFVAETIPATLRLHWSMRHREARVRRPAMVGLVEHVIDGAVGIHVTYLTPDRSRKASVEPVKRFIGPVGGGAVHLCGLVQGGVDGLESAEQGDHHERHTAPGVDHDRGEPLPEGVLEPVR